MPVINPTPSMPGNLKPTPTKPRPAPMPIVQGEFRVLSDFELDVHQNSNVLETTEGTCYDIMVFFGVDSHAVDSGARARIAQVVMGFGLQSRYFLIAASASRSGSTEHNLALAQKRLLSVQHILASLGVPMSMAFGPQHAVIGEQKAAFKGIKDGKETSADRNVVIRIGPSFETIEKMLFAMPFYTLISAGLIAHRNTSLG